MTQRETTGVFEGRGEAYDTNTNVRGELFLGRRTCTTVLHEDTRHGYLAVKPTTYDANNIVPSQSKKKENAIVAECAVRCGLKTPAPRSKQMTTLLIGGHLFFSLKFWSDK